MNSPRASVGCLLYGACVLHWLHDQHAASWSRAANGLQGHSGLPRRMPSGPTFVAGEPALIWPVWQLVTDPRDCAGTGRLLGFLVRSAVFVSP